MDEISPAEQAYNAARMGQIRRTLIWLQVRMRDSGALLPLGYWTGADDRSFTIKGSPRLYYGAGAALGIDDIEGGVGLEVRYLRARLAIRPETLQIIRAHDARLAPVEIHTVAFDLHSHTPIAPPRRIFLGSVNEAPIETGPDGTQASIELRMASRARDLTRKLALYKSDAEQQRRVPDGAPPDQFYRHAATTALRQIGWGETLRSQ